MERIRLSLGLMNKVVGGDYSVMVEGSECDVEKLLNKSHCCGCEGGGWFLMLVYGCIWGTKSGDEAPNMEAIEGPQ